jgi:hypothetical protein
MYATEVQAIYAYIPVWTAMLEADLRADLACCELSQNRKGTKHAVYPFIHTMSLKIYIKRGPSTEMEE